MSQIENTTTQNDNEDEDKGLFEIPRDPLVLKALRDGLKQIEDSKLRAASERTFQTEKVKELVDVTKIPNSVIRKLAKVVNEGGVQHLIDEAENLEALYVAINNPLEAQIASNDAVAAGLNPVLTASEADVQAAINASAGV